MKLSTILEQFHRHCWVVHKTGINDLYYFSGEINQIEGSHDLILLVILAEKTNQMKKQSVILV